MILEFRTERNKNGNCKYLIFDTGAETYATNCRTWISKDFPLIREKDRKLLIEKLEQCNYKKVEYVY